jgi:hypothetical protein
MFGDGISKGFYNREDNTFTFSNTLPIPIVLGILASSWVLTQFPRIRAIDSTIITDPNELSDYLELNNDKEMTPKKIKGIRLITDDVSQFSNPLNWQSLNADGNVLEFVDYPINLLSPMQFQSRVIDLYYENIIVGLNQFIALEFKPFTSVTMTFIYDDFRLENLLGKSKENLRQANYSKADTSAMEYLL